VTKGIAVLAVPWSQGNAWPSHHCEPRQARAVSVV
jgi:hypothetical protein